MEKIRFVLSALSVGALALAVQAGAEWEVAPAKTGPVNVLDYGAKGDGVHDDTPNIQAAINAVAARGGGKVFFPYTKKGYRLASPARETVGGKPCRSQLYIPPTRVNIQLEGEMPCMLLHDYIVIGAGADPSWPNHDPTRFGEQEAGNVRLVSDWKPPVETNAAARPWSVLSVIPGYASEAYPLNGSLVSLANLEFRAYLDKERMYAVQTAVDLSCASRAIVRDCQFALNDNIGDGLEGKELRESACATAGLIMSRVLNDDQVIYNVNVQGFKYGIVMGEHTHGLYLYLHNNEEALTFHDCSHLSVVNHIVAQHNTVILSTTSDELFGMHKGPCNVSVGTVNFECGTGLKPAVSQLRWGVYDPENRLHGELRWHKPWGKQEFPVCGAENFKVTHF